MNKEAWEIIGWMVIGCSIGLLIGFFAGNWQSISDVDKFQLRIQYMGDYICMDRLNETYLAEVSINETNLLIECWTPDNTFNWTAIRERGLDFNNTIELDLGKYENHAFLIH